MKLKIFVEHNNKKYEAIPHSFFDMNACFRCDLVEECSAQVPCLCSELIDLNYYFKEIENVQNNIQSRSVDHER